MDNKTININAVDIDSVEKEFDSLKKVLAKNEYTESESDDLVFNFLLHCRRMVSLIRDFPEQFENIRKIREIEAKAMEHWPSVNMASLRRAK